MSEKSLLEELSTSKVSAYQQYQSMFVGKTSFWELIKYELLVSWISPLPGALGYLLRKKCFPWVLGQVGQGTLFGRDVMLRNPSRIQLGEHVAIDDQVVMDAKGESSLIELGNQVLISRGGILSCREARIKVGGYVSIGPLCVIASRSFIDIGSNVAIASGVHILAGGHESDDPHVPVIKQPRTSKGISLEDNVWIGSGARILDGVTVGKNSIVGSGTVVNKDVPPFTVVLGNPARVIEKRKQD